MTTEEQEEYAATQVVDAPYSSIVQNQLQSPNSPVASYSTAFRTITPPGSPSTMSAFHRNIHTTSLVDIASTMSTSYDGDDDGYIASLKSSTDVYRERGASLRALALLNVDIAGVAPNDQPRPYSGMTAGRAAALKYEQQQKQKIAYKAADTLKQASFKRAPILVAPSRRNKLAETTRKVKKPSAEVEADFGIDSIADMKCQMDLDREEMAQRKALRLLNDGFMS
jgi:hypothetical protein